jgi:sigma-B regulation protein RsbU (phosphoserine phosphatase)
MNAASAALVHELRPKIIERRMRLQAAARTLSADYVNDLLAEIDATLQKIDNGSWGLCETCHDPIEADRLECNPLARFCVDHLTGAELRSHQQDLELATQIQSKLLPPIHLTTSHWETHFRYQPAGLVGGDYCEIVPSADGEALFFAVGDVAGKGVAASLLMTHLSAIFRSLLSLDLPLPDLLSRANHLFCESTPATHYATLAAGRTSGSSLAFCNAGHCRPLLLRQGATERVDAAGLPLGLFCDGRYAVTNLALDPGDSLVLYSDGITEAQDRDGNLYEEERLIRCLRAHAERDAAGMADGILRDVAHFCSTHPPHDDLTLLILRRR